jgi:hypothetical protein
MVSRSTWYRHYSDFHDQITGVWVNAEPDFPFSSSDESDSKKPWPVQPVQCGCPADVDSDCSEDIMVSTGTMGGVLEILR